MSSMEEEWVPGRSVRFTDCILNRLYREGRSPVQKVPFPLPRKDPLGKREGRSRREGRGRQREGGRPRDDDAHPRSVRKTFWYKDGTRVFKIILHIGLKGLHVRNNAQEKAT